MLLRQGISPYAIICRFPSMSVSRSRCSKFSHSHPTAASSNCSPGALPCLPMGSNRLNIALSWSIRKICRYAGCLIRHCCKKNKESTVSNVSGFPEWLPEERMVELKWLDEIRRVFESYGFCSLETPSVEEIDALLAKGETDKEIYAIRRLNADDEANEARLGLHFDLTIPLARYVAEHYGQLVFPFKRYQIQRVWRGERPQEGRFREFYQCDIDVINVDQVPLHFDAEMPAIMYDILSRLGVGQFQILISNRKILEGYLKGLGIEDTISAVRILDKLDKIGADDVITQLQSGLGLSRELAARCLALASIRTS